MGDPAQGLCWLCMHAACVKGRLKRQGATDPWSRPQPMADRHCGQYCFLPSEGTTYRHALFSLRNLQQAGPHLPQRYPAVRALGWPRWSCLPAASASWVTSPVPGSQHLVSGASGQSPPQTERTLQNGAHTACAVDAVRGLRGGSV